jgi:hypothetical protein
MSDAPTRVCVPLPAFAAAAAASDNDDNNRLPYLGGGSVNLFPRNTAYAASDLLPRPLSLPPPHSKGLEFQGGGKNRQATKDFFMAIHDVPLEVDIIFRPCPQQRYLTVSFSTLISQAHFPRPRGCLL